MSLLLKKCLIYDSRSSFNRLTVDVLIDEGLIVDIGDQLKGDKTVNLNGALMTPGWVDLNANFCDPGFEHKEDLLSGSYVAGKSGFTDICLQPNTDPVIDSKADIEYILSKSGSPVSLHPFAAISEGTRGENMTEILDLKAAGAVAFSDGLKGIVDSELLLKVLRYSSKCNGIVISRPRDKGLSSNTQMHEGAVSTRLGLKGEPSVSEKIQISIHLEILRYVGGRLHFSMVSTMEGIKLIKAAKKEGLNVTCDVCLYHLVFTDNNLVTFDTNFKMEPPFRTEKDRKALVKGVVDDTIDAIVTTHCPQDQENKLLEFDLADSGSIGLQTAFSVALSLEKEISLEKIIEKFTHGPRNVLGFTGGMIEVGAIAKLGVFDPKFEWMFDGTTNLSKSKNSPFFGNKCVGKSLGIINGTQNSISE